MRTIRSLALVSTLIMVAIILTPRQAVEARATYQGSIQIHAAVCPVGAVDLSSGCAQGRPPIGVMVAIDAGPAQALDGGGNLSVEDLVAGDHLVVVLSTPYAERYSQVQAFCSNSVTGLYQSPAIVLAQDDPTFQVRIAPRSQVTCGLHFIP